LQSAYETASQIDLFNLHDAEILAIEVGDTATRLDLRFAYIGKNHPANPHGTDQLIKPCSLVFHGVSDHVVQLWNETARTFLPHAEPTRPIDDCIIQFDASGPEGDTAITLSGFHRLGWSEWRFRCTSVSIAWSAFCGGAWYDRAAD
jgi:hypothetical protein